MRKPENQGKCGGKPEKAVFFRGKLEKDPLLPTLIYGSFLDVTWLLSHYKHAV